MPIIYYWPQKNKPQALSYLHKLSLDGVVLQQGPNEVSDQELERVKSHPDLPSLMACGAIELGEPVQTNPIQPEPEPPDTQDPPALILINNSDIPRDVAIIPSLGQAAAKRIIANRPLGGYASLAHVWQANPEVLGGRMQVNPEVVAAWGGNGD